MEPEPAEGTRYGSGWRLVRITGEMLRRWRAGWRETPAAARRRWLWTTAIGWAVLLALVIGVASLGAAHLPGPLPGESAFDLALLRALHLKLNAAIWLQTMGMDIPLIVVLVATVGPLAWRGRALEALSVLGAYVLVYTAVNLSWVVWGRARPTIIAGGSAAPGFSSFPSGHTAKAFAVYGILAYLWARRTDSLSERVAAFVLVFGMSALVGLGRMGMGAHWPTDVAGGAFFGLVMMLIMILALRAAEGAARAGR